MLILPINYKIVCSPHKECRIPRTI
jgi:hypothetical protein